jgi:hypothetical protein
MEDVNSIKQAKSAFVLKGDYIDYDDIFATLIIEKPDEFKGNNYNSC